MVKNRLSKQYEQFRKESLMFSVATILATPFLLILALFLIVVALVYSTPLDLVDYSPTSLMTGLNICLALLAGSFLTGRVRRAKWSEMLGSFLAAIGVYLALLFLSYGTQLSSSSPGLFWGLYGVLSITMMGALGRAYTPRDSYYLGFCNGHWDDPFTLRDDVDRAHIGLGIAIALPNLILSSYGRIFGDLWLWQAPDFGAMETASRVLTTLADNKKNEAEKLLKRLGDRNAAYVSRLLITMDLVAFTKNGLILTPKGRKLTRD